MAIKKRAYQKTHKIFLYSGGSLAVLIAFLFGMSAYGVTPEISDKTIKCFGYNINDPSNTSTDCVDYFNITLDSWHLCFNKDFDLYLNDTDGVNLIVYKADRRYRIDNPNRWKLYNFDTCLKNATKHEFKVELRTLDQKPLNRSIKWGLKYGITDVDPAFSSVTVEDIFTALIENKADLSHGTATFKISNPTAFDVPISSKLFKIWIEEFKGNPVNNISIYYLANITKTNAVPTFNTLCDPYDKIIPNGTEHYDNCTQSFAGYRNETVKYTDFVPFNLTTFKAKSDLTIKITARWSPHTGEVSKDWKPSINMSGLVYKQDKWAWFNTSFTNCANWTIVNNMVSTQMHGFYFYNFTSLTNKQADSDDVRIVNAACNAGGSDIRYNVYTNTSTSTYALVELDIPANTNTNYSVYWNNPSATAPSYPSIDLSFVDVSNDQRKFTNQYWNLTVNNGTTAGISITGTQTYLKAYSNSTSLGAVDTSSSTETWTGCSGRISFNGTLMKEFTATCNEGVGIHRFFDNYTFWNTNMNITTGGTANTLALGGWKPNGSVDIFSAYKDDSGVVNIQQPASVAWATGGTNISDGWFVGYLAGGGNPSDSIWGVAWNQSNAFATDAGKTWYKDHQDTSGRYLGINGRGGADNTMKNFSAWYGLYMPRTGEQPWTQTEILNNITEYPPTFTQGTTETAPVVLQNATIRVLLDSQNANRSYELGTNVTIYANFSDSNGLITTDSFCLDIDQNDYRTNYSCSATGEIRYNYTNDYSAKNYFSNGYTNVTTGVSTSCCNTLTNYTTIDEGSNQIGGTSLGTEGSVWFLNNNQTNWIGSITFNISCRLSPLNVSLSLLETNNLYDISGTEVKRVNFNLTKTYNCSEGWPDRLFNVRNVSIDSPITYGKNVAIKFYVDNNNDGSPENVTSSARPGFSDGGFSGAIKYSACWLNFTECTYRYDPLISFYLGANLTQNASIEMYGGDELLNASMNISGTNAQNTILSISGTKIYEIPGWLQSNQTYQDMFTNNLTSETVTVDTAYTRYIRLLTNKSIVTANMTINGVQSEVLAVNQTIDGEDDLYGSVGQNFTLTSNTEISSFQFFVRDVGTQCCSNPQTNVSIKCGIINRTTGNVLVNSSIVLITTDRGGPNNVFVTCPINRINLTSGGDYLLFFNQTGEPFQFYRVGKSSNIGDLYVPGVAFNFTTSFGVGGGWNYPGTPLTRDLKFKVFTTSLSENLTIDFGSNGVDDYNRTGVLNASFTLNISTSLVESFANSSKSYCNGLSVCNVPIKFKLGKGGTINVSSINFTYTGYNPIRIPIINWTQILNGSIPNNKINLTIVHNTNNEANVTYSNLNVTYKGSDTINITAHFGGNATHNPSNYTLASNIYYSNYNYTFPKNIKYLEFISNPVAVNVSAFGQTGAIPIFNVTTRNYDQPMNFSIRLNESTNCVNFTASNTSSPSNGFLLSTTFQNLWVNKSVNYNSGLWLWAHYNCSSTGWNLYNPEFIFRGACVGCIADSGI